MSRQLRIFVPSAAELLTDHLPNGEGLIAWHLFSAIAARGHELVVCARAAELLQAAPFELITTGRASRWESREPLAYASRMGRLFEQMGGAARFDVVHWLFPQDAPLPTLRASAARFVVGPQSLSWTDSTRRARPLRLGDLVRRTVTPFEHARRSQGLGRSAVVLVSSPAAVADVPARFRSKARVLPFGVDVERFSSAALPGQPAVLFVGSLERKKGVHELVEAFAVVAGRLPGATLVVAGDGPERPWLEARIRELGLTHQVELRGRTDHGAIPALFDASALVCLPSHGEPFGMTVLEAMAAGRAVVAVDEGGPRFLVDRMQGGRLVPRESPSALADALVELLEDRPLLERMASFNRARVEAEFALDVIVDGLERIYRGSSLPAPRPQLATASGAAS